MTTLTAVAGGGDFMTAATWSPAQQPTAADDCVLNASSGNVTISVNALARSLSCTGYTGTVTHTAGINLDLGDGTAGAGNVALKLVAGMTYTPPFNATIRFLSTSATQQTITTASKTLGNTQFFGVGGNFVLSDSLTLAATSTLTLAAGTFATANLAMSLGLVVISGASAKTLTLGSSAIAITGNSTAAVAVTGSNITFTSNTAVLTFSGASAGTSSSGANNWNGTSAVFTTTVSAVVLSNSSFNNVTYTSPATKTATFSINGNSAATGTLTITGNSATNRILMQSNTAGTTRTVTVGTAVSLSNVDFSDITAAGAAGTWTGTSMGNALGNSNITFDAPVTQTRSGAGGNWSTAANWTSRVPLPQDDVSITSGSSGTITADMPRLGATLTITGGFGGTVAFSSVANTLYGSITLGAAMTVSGTQNLTLAARNSQTITSNGKTFTQQVSIGAPGSTYTLQDTFNTAGGLISTTGTLNGNNQNVTASFFNNSGAATTNPGSGTWTITTTLAAFWAINSGTFNGAAATIVLATATATARTFAGLGQSYGTLTYTVAGSTGSLTITGANTFGTINFSDVTNARSLLFTAATTTTVTNWNVNGTSGKLMTVDCSTAATFTLSKASGTVSSDFLSVKNSLAGGGATWFAGANSTDAGGDTGWIFRAPGSNFLGMFM